ncbi:MAG: cadherin-like domain-containing protein, partial [Planctomycetota bacterium]
LNAAELLTNDNDPDVNDRLSLTGIEATSSLGAVITLVNDHFVYDPTGVASLAALSAGERLSDQIVYTIEDPSGATSSATATIHV